MALAEARVNEARNTVGIAESDVEGAAAAPHQVTASEARISAASAEIARVRTAVEQAQLDLEYTVVRAPVAGIVSRKNVGNRNRHSARSALDGGRASGRCVDHGEL